MIVKLFLMRMKCLLRDKQNVFWTALFPIFLSFVFHAAFANLYSSEQFDTIPIAIVHEADSAGYLLDAAKLASFSEDKAMFKVTECTEDEAKDLLKDGDVVGYVLDKEKPELFLGGSGIEATIVKSFIDSYLQTSRMVTTVIATDPMKAQQVADLAMERVEYINDTNTDGKKPDYVLIYFYALLAMACMNGSNWGLKEIGDIQADKSATGARINVAPIHKMKLLLCNLLAVFTVQFACLLVAFVFMYQVLHIDFGAQLPYVIGTCALGCLCGITFGAMLRSIIRKNYKVVDAISSALVLFLSFLSGLMIPSMKYIVATYIPILGKLNPVNLISDSFYCLYYYDTMDRYYENIAVLAAITVVFTVITYLATRRRQYASI
ncbi:MAG TPA: ABC transporter permease [Lachnospiraceae bacterium]|nr:ABC transporter permease [Lachnospiraceae bacterium]